MSEPQMVFSLWKGEVPIRHRQGTTISTRTRDEVVQEVSQYLKVPARCILSRETGHVTSHARHMVIWTLRQFRQADGEAKYSYPAIGLAMGRDHTSAISSCRKWESIRAAWRLALTDAGWIAEGS